MGTADHWFEDDLNGVYHSFMFIPSVSFRLEALEDGMALAAFESNF